MKTCLRKHKGIIIQIAIQVIFIFLSLAIVSSYLRSNSIAGLTNSDILDIKYYLQHCEEIILDLRNGILPSFNHFAGIRGLAESICYPQVPFALIIFLMLIHMPLIVILKINEVLVPFLLMNTIYFASHKYWNNKLISFIISCVYPCLYLTIGMITQSIDFSIGYGLSAMILAIFGYLYYMRNNKWKMLVCGMALLCYTSFVLSALTLVTLITLSLFNIFKFNKNKILIGFKATFITLLITMSIWLPLLVLNMTNKLYLPITNIVLDNMGNRFINFIQATSIMSIVCFIIGLLKWKSLTSVCHKLIIVSGLYEIICLNAIPLKIIQDTPFASVQYLQRLGYMTNLLILIAVVPFIVNECSKRANIKTLVITLLITLSITLSISIPILLSNVTKRNTSTHRIYTNKSLRILSNIQQGQERQINFKSIQRHISKLNQQYYLSEFSPNSTVNFYGKQSPKTLIHMSIIKSYYPNLILQHSLKTHHMNNINKGIIIHQNHKAQRIRVPIICYHGQKYHFYKDNKKIYPITYKNHEPIINIPKGTHSITFTTPYMWYHTLANIISIIGICVFAFNDIRSRKHK